VKPLLNNNGGHSPDHSHHYTNQSHSGNNNLAILSSFNSNPSAVYMNPMLLPQHKKQSSTQTVSGGLPLNGGKKNKKRMNTLAHQAFLD
jgi:hypothetical protein